MSLFFGHELACLRGPRLVFAGLGFRVEPGGALLLTGRNGSGKSTLLRLMAGLLPPFAGALGWEDLDILENPAAHHVRCVYIGHQDAIKPTLTPAEDLAFWAGLAHPREAGARARMALEAYGALPLADLPGRYLSAGQRRRVALARALAAPGPLWLLDEPTTALDAEGQAQLTEAIRRHRDGGGLLVAATHGGLDLPGAEALDLGAFAVRDTGEEGALECIAHAGAAGAGTA